MVQQVEGNCTFDRQLYLAKIVRLPPLGEAPAKRVKGAYYRKNASWLKSPMRYVIMDL